MFKIQTRPGHLDPQMIFLVERQAGTVISTESAVASESLRCRNEPAERPHRRSGNVAIGQSSACSPAAVSWVTSGLLTPTVSRLQLQQKPPLQMLQLIRINDFQIL